jgi:hypothetical protein
MGKCIKLDVKFVTKLRVKKKYWPLNWIVFENMAIGKKF